MSACRWGILGTAEIARKNWKAILNAPSAELQAVASRRKESAEAFIERCQTAAPFPQPPAALGSYQSLVDSSGIDAVYLPIPTGLRTDWAVRCAEAGKHVLIEKPAGIDAKEVQRIVDACQANNVQLMDGVMFMHHPRLESLKAALEDQAVFGELKHMISAFAFYGDDTFMASNIRVDRQLEPSGCIGDLGWYCIRLALWAMDWEMPFEVSARMHSANVDGVPLAVSAQLHFERASASFYCAFESAPIQRFVIAGTNGIVSMDDFVLPYGNRRPQFSVASDQFQIGECDFVMTSHSEAKLAEESVEGTATAQESRMFEAFSQLALRSNPDRCWSDFIIATQRVSDAVLESAKNGQTVSLSS